jgi:hypothetical protein
MRDTTQAWRGWRGLRIAHIQTTIGTAARRQGARSTVVAHPKSTARARVLWLRVRHHPGQRPGAARLRARSAARSERRDAPAERPGAMIPSGRKRLPLEAPLMRVVATGVIVGIGLVIAAIMTSQDSQGWLIGLVVSIVSVVLAAVLWSSRRLEAPPASNSSGGHGA